MMKRASPWLVWLLTALLWAGGCKTPEPGPEALAVRQTRTFLDRGGRIDAPLESGSSRLHEACRKGYARWARFCLEAGADPDRPDPAGSRPVHIACSSGDFQTLKVLLEYQPDVNAPDSRGRAGLHRALESRNWPAARLLLMGRALPCRADRKGYTPLHLAAEQGPPDILAKLLRKAPHCVDAQDSQGRTPLMCAAAENRPEAVHLLLQAGADPDILDARGRTAAMRSSLPAIHEMLRSIPDGSNSATEQNDSLQNAD